MVSSVSTQCCCPGGSEETLVPLLGEQATETTNPEEVECPWKSHTGEGKQLVLVTV